jgi:GNAT superfamily N-acetyltransferase
MCAEDRVFAVREFDPSWDKEAVRRCYIDSFYHNSWPLIDHAEPRVIDDIFTTTLKAAQVALVAEADGEARGILVGYFPREGFAELRLGARWLVYLGRVLFRRYRMTPFARAAFWRHATSMFSFLIRSRRTPAEVLLLGSQNGYRQGIGRALMDAWVAEVRVHGYQKTTVSTDSTVSWDFYERYGFKRLKQFPIKMFYHSLPGVDVTGYIYSLDLDEHFGGQA